MIDRTTFLPAFSMEGRGGTILNADEGEEGGGGGELEIAAIEDIGGKGGDPDGSVFGDDVPLTPIFMSASISVVIVCSS